jgi:hypothetical protein
MEVMLLVQTIARKAFRRVFWHVIWTDKLMHLTTTFLHSYTVSFQDLVVFRIRLWSDYRTS